MKEPLFFVKGEHYDYAIMSINCLLSISPYLPQIFSSSYKLMIILECSVYYHSKLQLLVIFHIYYIKLLARDIVNTLEHNQNIIKLMICKNYPLWYI